MLSDKLAREFKQVLEDRYRTLREEISTQRAENEQLRVRNRTLAAEVQDLKKGTTAIEERARTDLGMVGKGETFYQVVVPRAASAPAAAGEDATRMAQSPGPGEPR